LLNYRLTGDPNYLTQCAIGHNNERAGYHSYVFNRSFFDLSDREVFVDGGAFDGDSIEGFVRAVKGKFRRIYSFEPSPELAEKSASRVRKLNGLFPGSVAKRVTLIRKGLWTHSTTLTFNPTLFSGNEADYVDGIPQSAHIVESGITKHLYDTDTEARLGFSIETTSIDEACEEPVSFIKLEIEGSELAALEGARRTIVSARPKMALSIYHKPEDLLTLTKYVMDTCLDYRLSLRQHNSMIPDATVCYCR
jgi:FkbM family methyltransferase